MVDRGWFLSRQAIGRQLAAMPHELYLVRLIHHVTRRAFPGERLWTAAQLTREPTIRFLRIRNLEGCDVYIQPYANNRNAGYILLDLDHGDATALDLMRAHGHEPCVVVQTSPGHLQAWIRISDTPLEPAIATTIAKQLARLYRADPASADWRHLGRLAGFTNQKPLRRQPNGYAPWVRLLYARDGFARQAGALVQAAQRQASITGPVIGTRTLPAPLQERMAPTDIAAAANEIYLAWLHRLRIPQRFPQPDWSIADKWIAKELLRRGTPVAVVETVLRCGSPGFPRRHAVPDDYLRRTLARAMNELHAVAFPAPGAPAAHCVVDPLPSPHPPLRISAEHHCRLPSDTDRGETS